ncbi:hypothetical protein PROFUN_09044 [Planoprotostelium fungivorum]|uniref:Kinesin-like protein n=1 Tax=Planoprotostelium fungivorum TaxID=1890364 RepID=A0A2P6MV13_9EUKA|nr:hypothetical protein PROFUN_09044 [Planoprotostelium fungivorum]
MTALAQSSEYTVGAIDTGNPNLMGQTHECQGKLFRCTSADSPDEHVLIFDPPSASTPSRAGRVPRILSKKPRDYRYAFDYVFNEYTPGQDVYEKTVKHLIEPVMDGFNATVFAYGATGSGKTHTMIGHGNGEGVMYLTMRDIFEAVEATSHEKKASITISYLEIYNETIRDLLVPESPPLMLCESEAGATVAGLTEKNPQNAEDVMALLEYGGDVILRLSLTCIGFNRRQSPTEANARSSRSHAILQVTVNVTDRTGNVSGVIRTSKLSLIDLAGSERASVSNNRGERLKEGANINKSLLALGNCINSLGENYKKGSHVPYRNSKLTRLLKDSLGGNCRTVMIAAISPSSLSQEDTLNTLKYANRAKNIKTNVTKNVQNVDYHVGKYTQIISELREEVSELKAKLSTVGDPAQNSQLEIHYASLFYLAQIQHRALVENGLESNELRSGYLLAVDTFNRHREERTHRLEQNHPTNTNHPTGTHHEEPKIKGSAIITAQLETSLRSISAYFPPSSVPAASLSEGPTVPNPTPTTQRTNHLHITKSEGNGISHAIHNRGAVIIPNSSGPQGNPQRVVKKKPSPTGPARTDAQKRATINLSVQSVPKRTPLRSVSVMGLASEPRPPTVPPVRKSVDRQRMRPAPPPLEVRPAVKEVSSDAVQASPSKKSSLWAIPTLKLLGRKEKEEKVSSTPAPVGRARSHTLATPRVMSPLDNFSVSVPRGGQ